MKPIFKLLLIYHLSFTIYHSLNAQNIGINGSGANAHPSALLDVDAISTPSLGILIPRIALQAINLSAPVTSPATSLLVYNTASASTGTNAVSAGYYYWDGVKWVRFAYSPSGVSANDWNTLGNAGTVASTNFIGTTDNIDLVFRRNNVRAGLLNNSLLNTAFGVNSLLSSTGGANVAIGHGAMQANTNGGNNVAVGANSMLSNTIGRQNVAVGPNTLRDNISGTENTAVGSSAMLTNITGSANIGIGNGAMYFNTSGNNNTGVGFVSLYNNTTGLSNSGNGIATLFSNTTGSHNSAHGADVMHSNTTGSFNTASGSSAMYANITGSANVAAGYLAMPTNAIGGNNISIGYRSMYNSTISNNNTANGFESLFGNTTGNNNSALGANSLKQTSTGEENTALGVSSGTTNMTGHRNTLLGAFADVTGNNFVNATAIGYNAKVGQNNALILGGTVADAVNVGIGTTTPANRFTIETGDMQLGEVIPNVGLGRRLYFSDAFNSTDPIYFQRENMSLDNSHLNLILGDNLLGDDKFNIKNTSGNTFLTVQNNGNVGIGDIAPAYKLIVKSYDINSAISAYIVNSPTLTANSATNFHGSWSTVVPNSALNFTGDLYGAVNRIQTGVGQTGSINGLIGATNDVIHYSSANITNARGSTNIISNVSSGVITNAFGSLCEVQNSGGGTITNGYGLNIGIVQATNKWSVYASDASAPSYFAGSVGIGTPTPSFPLHVIGTIHSSTGTFSSDKRLKQNIKNITTGLSVVKKLNPVSYDWIKPTDKGMQGTQMGFIAQELEEILPSMVLTSDDEQKTKSVKYHEMLPILVKAIQELDTKNSEQQLLIESLKKEIETLKQK